MNAVNNDEVDDSHQTEDNNEENVNNQQQHQDTSSGNLKEAPPSPPRSQNSAAVDMAGTVKSPIGIISKIAKRSSRKSGTMFSKNNKGSNNNKGNQDESMNKQRFRYSANGSDEDEWERSDMDFSRQSGVDNTMSRELTVQQIHDQRAKLSGGINLSNTTTTHQATPAPPASHQLSSASEKGPKSSNTPMVPGAFSVDLSGRDVSVAAKAKGEDDSSVLDNEYASSIMDTNTEMEASTIMQLEAVPVDESLEQAKLKDMEDQMNREIQRRLSLERKVAESEHSQTNNHSGHKTSCIKEKIPIIMAIFVILSGIAVGLYFLLAPNDETQNIMESPYFIYPPPTDEECEAVENGAEVPNQDTYSTVAMSSTLDVSYIAAEVDSVDKVRLEIKEAYEDIIPTLMGCEEYFDQPLAEDRYLMANAKVMSVIRSTSDCDADMPRPCVRVTVNAMNWVKAETSLLDLIAFVQATSGPMLLQRLEESEVIFQNNLVSLGPSQHMNLLYPPPTAEECEAVSNGDAVPNQNQYYTSVVDITMDISFDEASKSSFDEIVSEVRDRIELSMGPILVGCNSAGQEIYNRTNTEVQYIFANLNVMDVTRSATECYDANPRPCVQVDSRIFLWLKREYDVFDMISFVHSNFQFVLRAAMQDSDIIQHTELVSAGPAPVQFEYPPPSEEQCEDIINGSPVPGRDEYFTQLADTVIDVSTHEPWGDSLDTVLLEFRNTWQTLIIPTLAGCMDKVDETWRDSTKTPERYIPFDTTLLNVTHVPGECTPGEPRPCLRVGIRSRMWLKRELDFFSIINLIDKNYGPPLMAKIGNREDNSTTIKQAEIVIMTPVFDDPGPIDTPQPDSDTPQLDFEFEFPPPTKEQCDTIVDGAAIPGQDEYFTQLTDTVVDVSIHEPWEDSLDTVLLEIRNTWETIIHPTLAGCMDTAETLLNSTVTRDRYVMGNAVVLDVNQVPGGECKAEEPRPCIRVGIRGQIWLKKRMNFFDIISMIERNYGESLTLKVGNQDDTSAIIKQVQVIIMQPVF